MRMTKNVSSGLLLQLYIMRILGLILRESQTSEGSKIIAIGLD